MGAWAARESRSGGRKNVGLARWLGRTTQKKRSGDQELVSLMVLLEGGGGIQPKLERGTREGQKVAFLVRSLGGEKVGATDHKRLPKVRKRKKKNGMGPRQRELENSIEEGVGGWDQAKIWGKDLFFKIGRGGAGHYYARKPGVKV